MSVSNIDSELRPLLEAFKGMQLDFGPSGLHRTRELLRKTIDSGRLRRPSSVVVEDIESLDSAGDSGPSLRIYRPTATTAAVPVLYWMHGGGMVFGSFDMDDELLVGAVEELGLAVVSVEYRLAPEHPDPVPIEDCYAGLVWLATNAPRYGIDPTRIAIGGASAGGGLAAGLALLARDREGPGVIFQLLLEPMLDDRATTQSATEYEGTVVWDRNDNRAGWTALLGTRVGTAEVSPYAAPARATSLVGLPPAFVDVGEVETFRDESIDYAQRLMAAGVSTELHVHRGAFHGFDLFAPDSGIARQAWGLRWAAVARALAPPSPAI
jgi:acetyl esterase/lipase